MTNPNNIDLMNREALFLLHACLGEISRNIIYIALLPIKTGSRLFFALENDDDTDRESIQDIVDDFYAMHDDDPEIDVVIEIAPKNKLPPAPPARAIYIRKE